MPTTTDLRAAVRAYPARGAINRSATKGLQRRYLLALEYLGDRWVLRGGTANWRSRKADTLVVLVCVISLFPWEWI